MTPPAPPRFSITSVWPRFSCRAGATLRVTMSVPPPGAAGTTRRIGLAGYCASAGAARSPARASAMNRITAPPPKNGRDLVEAGARQYRFRRGRLQVLNELAGEVRVGRLAHHPGGVG